MIAIAFGAMWAADPSDWKNLEVLKAGDKVGIVQMNQKRVVSWFEGVSDAGISVEGATVAKDQVARVYRPAGMSRTMRVLIGAGVGLAVGVVLTQTIRRRFENDGGKFGGIPNEGWYPICVGAGAGLGAVSGSGYVTVYQRR